MSRTVEFLEATAQRLPNQGINYGRAQVCFVSLSGRFMYCERFDGGSTRRVERDQINALIQQKV